MMMMMMMMIIIIIIIKMIIIIIITIIIIKMIIIIIIITIIIIKMIIIIIITIIIIILHKHLHAIGQVIQTFKQMSRSIIIIMTHNSIFIPPHKLALNLPQSTHPTTKFVVLNFGELKPGLLIPQFWCNVTTIPLIPFEYRRYFLQLAILDTNTF